MSGWEAHFQHDHINQRVRLVILRRNHDDSIDVLDPDLVGYTRRFAPATTVDENAGMWMPVEAYEALKKAMRPDTEPGEVKRLEEALAVERRRVDGVLANVTGAAWATGGA